MKEEMNQHMKKEKENSNGTYFMGRTCI
jgi:hypothetical protein